MNCQIDYVCGSDPGWTLSGRFSGVGSSCRPVGLLCAAAAAAAAAAPAFLKNFQYNSDKCVQEAAFWNFVAEIRRLTIMR